ncbi:ABC transporter permease [Anaeromyxobacter oryzisoli]|uniref:ABC transporter permease n=1 Tax=Anaeromyxobacter oryzisoli TaxID=2925408 RepID=UPI001F5ABEC9|nr:ABC transporter permease subunit [Anaeromyxobacter sp. SG63]
MKRLARRYAGTLAVVAVAVLLFELATDVTGWLEPVLFPGLRLILPALWRSLPKLLEGLVSSVGLLLPGYAAALVLGIAMGLVVGWYAPLRHTLMPIFRALSPLPPTLLIPYVIALLPTFWLSSFFIIFIGSFWPILMATIHGVVLVEDRYLDNARALGLSGARLLRLVILPAALPVIFTGAGMALVFSFILLTVAEMFGARSGLGFFIQHNADFSEYAKVLGGMLFTSAFIVLVMAAFDGIQGRLLHWTARR